MEQPPLIGDILMSIKFWPMKRQRPKITNPLTAAIKASSVGESVVKDRMRPAGNSPMVDKAATSKQKNMTANIRTEEYLKR